jgi:hypothetical protein
MDQTWVDEIAKKQGIKLAQGRAGKIAAALEPLITAPDAMRETLDFEVDATTYLKTIAK